MSVIIFYTYTHLTFHVLDVYYIIVDVRNINTFLIVMKRLTSGDTLSILIKESLTNCVVTDFVYEKVFLFLIIL